MDFERLIASLNNCIILESVIVIAIRNEINCAALFWSECAYRRWAFRRWVRHLTMGNASCVAIHEALYNHSHLTRALGKPHPFLFKQQLWLSIAYFTSLPSIIIMGPLVRCLTHLPQRTKVITITQCSLSVDSHHMSLRDIENTQYLDIP